MVSEARLELTETGLVPTRTGWFVVNARESRWYENPDFGAFTLFENRRDAKFERLGINIAVLQPGKPSCYYHREDDQEDFLVLAGECVLLIEGEERRVKAWDFVHCPPMTDHVFVGAGAGPCVIVAVGSRTSDEGVYPVSELALRYGAGAAEETADAETAYANTAKSEPTTYREGWLPD